MALEEITAESTSEEVKAYAERTVEEVLAERAGEKSDAQITAEHANNEHKTPVAGSPKGESDETAKPKGKGEEAGEESWLTEDLKAEAAAIGIEESELTDFASREELERTMRLFDKKALEAGRKAQAEAEGKQSRDDKGKFVKKEPTDQKPAEGKPAEGKKDGRYELSQTFRDVYDPDIVNELDRMRDHYETRVEALETRFAQADARAEEQQFDNFVDALGHTDLFGKSDEEDAKQLQRRTDLHVAVKAQLLGLAQLGRPAALSESLVSRVARMVFAEELGKKDLKNLTRKISKQSAGRQGGGATRPQDPREDPRDEFDRLYKELAGS